MGVLTSEDKSDLIHLVKCVYGIKSEAVQEAFLSKARIHKLSAKDILIQENEAVHEVPFLLQGITKGYSKNFKGDIQVHCFQHLKGEVPLGITYLSFPMITMHTIEAVTPCRIALLPLEFIYELTKTNLEAALVCNRMVGRCSRKVYEEKQILLQYNLSQRYEYFRDTYPDLLPYLNKKDIASFLNMTPESFSRVLKKVEE